MVVTPGLLEALGGVRGWPVNVVTQGHLAGLTIGEGLGHSMRMWSPGPETSKPLKLVSCKHSFISIIYNSMNLLGLSVS